MYVWGEIFVPLLEKVICIDEDVITKEEIYSRFAIIGLFLTAVLCLVPLGQLIEISVRAQLLIYPAYNQITFEHAVQSHAIEITISAVCQ